MECVYFPFKWVKKRFISIFSWTQSCFPCQNENWILSSGKKVEKFDSSFKAHGLVFIVECSLKKITDANNVTPRCTGSVRIKRMLTCFVVKLWDGVRFIKRNNCNSGKVQLYFILKHRFSEQVNYQILISSNLHVQPIKKSKA